MEVQRAADRNSKNGFHSGPKEVWGPKKKGLVHIKNQQMEWKPSLTARELWQDRVNTSRSYSMSHDVLDNIPQRITKTSLDEIPTIVEMARAIAGLKDGKIETIVHCARVPTLPQRSRNVHNLITLPLCKQISNNRDQGVRVCYVNAQSCRNKTLAIADHILDNQLDMMATSETWLKSSRDSNVIKDIVPNGYCIKHTPRPIGKGGGVAIIHKSEIVLQKQDTDAFRSFEHIECRLKTPMSSMRIVVVYRPPPSAKNGLTTTVFFEEWDRFIDQHTIKPGPFIMMGDLNIHIDNTTNADARRLINSVNATGMVLHVREPMFPQEWSHVRCTHDPQHGRTPSAKGHHCGHGPFRPFCCEFEYTRCSTSHWFNENQISENTRYRCSGFSTRYSTVPFQWARRAERGWTSWPVW